MFLAAGTATHRTIQFGRSELGPGAQALETGKFPPESHAHPAAQTVPSQGGLINFERAYCHLHGGNPEEDCC